MNGYLVDYASIVLNYMYQVASVSRTRLLPYSNLLTRIFNHFKVPLDLEDCVTQSVPMISAHSLRTLCFYKIKPRGWQHVIDLTPGEASALKVSLPNHPSSPNLAEALVGLKEDQAEHRN